MRLPEPAGAAWSRARIARIVRPERSPSRCSLPRALALAASVAAVASAAPPRAASPVDHLPGNVRQLTAFGERPDWSHDGRRILFLSKVFGDVYELEIATGRITPVTDHFQHHGFTRALYLSNGDVLLSGPVATFDRVDKDARQQARSSSFLSVLDRSFKRPPVPLGVHCDEGPAVSRRQLRIAWTHGRQDRISFGEIAYVDGTARLVDVKPVLAVADFPAGERPQRWIETQNFVPPEDARLTVTGYEINGSANSECFVVDLATRALVNVSRSPDHYEECEGVFPDGRFTLVERAEHRGNHWPLIDAWKLALDGSGAVERLTSFTEFEGYKGGEPVVSDDGRHFVFTLGKSGMEAGQGFGLFSPRSRDAAMSGTGQTIGEIASSLGR
jgi:hypothetical protein